MSETETLSETGLPSLEDVLLSVSEEGSLQYEQKYEENFNQLSLSGEIEYQHLRGVKDHYTLKKCWAIFVMVMMFLMIIFQMGLLIAVGVNGLDYTKYEWLLPTLMIQYFGQIVGLAYIIVKSLFKKIY